MEFVVFIKWFILLSFLASLTVYFRKQSAYSYLFYFPPILFVTFGVEVIGAYMASKGKPNILLFNFFSILWVCYYLFIISQMIVNLKIKRVIWVTIAVYFLIVTSQLIFVQKLQPTVFNTIPHSLGFLIIVIFCIYYFYELFRMPKYVNLKNNPAFWICFGLLFFCACGFPLWGFFNVWAKIPLVVNNFMTIITILNFFLYSLFIIGFLCLKAPKYTLSSS